MILTKGHERSIALAARVAVLELAADPLPLEEPARTREGKHRKHLAVKATVEATKAQARCKCSPEQVANGVQTAKLVVQAVYDLLVMFGAIRSNGKAA